MVLGTAWSPVSLMRTAIWVTGFTMTLTPTMTYFQTGTMTFTLGMSMLAPARRTYPSGDHMMIVVCTPPLLFILLVLFSHIFHPPKLSFIPG